MAGAKGLAGKKAKAKQMRPSMSSKPSKPKAKARPAARKPAQRSAPSKSVHSFDPCVVGIPPSLSAITNVFPITQTIRLDLDTVLGRDYMLFVSGVPGCANQGLLVDYSPTGALPAPVLTNFTLPLLTNSATTGGPTSSKISKCGVRIENATAPLYMGGSRVFLSHLDQRLRLPAAPGSMTGTEWETTAMVLRSLPPRMLQAYGADAFGSNGVVGGKSFYTHIVDEVDYAQFDNHRGTISGNDYMQHIAVWPTSVETARPMSTKVFLIKGPPSAQFAQTLILNVDAQLLTRWAIDTVPGISSATVPASDATKCNAARSEALKAATYHKEPPGWAVV